MALIVVIVHGAAASVRAQEDSGLKTVRQLWQMPTPDYRMKTWWFFGYGFVTLPDVGVLQASNDSIAWRDIVPLDPMYNSQGGYRIRTTAFEPTEGRYWRVRYTEGSRPLSWWYVGCEPKMDRWEERAALQSDFAEAELTPESYNRQGVIVPSQVRPIADGDFSTLPAGRSMVMLRQGKAAPDVLVFLGDDVPVKTITSRLPAGLDGLDWDVCTADALRNRLTTSEGRLQTPDGTVRTLYPDADGLFTLELSPTLSVFFVVGE